MATIILFTLSEKESISMLKTSINEKNKYRKLRRSAACFGNLSRPGINMRESISKESNHLIIKENFEIEMLVVSRSAVLTSYCR